MELSLLPISALVLGVALLAAVCAQLVVSRRMRRSGWWALLAALGIGGAMLMPGSWLDPPLIGVAALVGLLAATQPLLRIVAALLLGGCAYLLGRYFPGGTLGFVVTVLGLVGLAIIVAAARRLRRMARAEALVPGELPAHDVELGGIVVARERLPLPGFPGRQVAAWELVIGDQRRRSETLVPVIAAEGTVLVDPREVRWDLDQSRVLSGAERVAEAAEQAGIEPAALGIPAPDTAVRTWLENGAEVYVVGRPTWQPDPQGSATYREAPMLPLFAGPQAFLADRPEDKLAAEATFRMISWSLWLPPLMLAGVVAALR